MLMRCRRPEKGAYFGAAECGARRHVNVWEDARMPNMHDTPPESRSFISDSDDLGRLARDYLRAVLDRRRDQAAALVVDAVQSGVAVRDVYLRVFAPAQYEVGRLWQLNQVSVAQEHYCTATTQLVMSRLYPYVFATERNGLTMIGCCVSGELHELGMRMVADFFELDGWDTSYLGPVSDPRRVAEEVAARGAHLACISVSMSYHLPLVRPIVDALRAEPGAGACRILVGGGPFRSDPELWRTVGADGSGIDAGHALATARTLVLGDAA